MMRRHFVLSFSVSAAWILHTSSRHKPPPAVQENESIFCHRLAKVGIHPAKRQRLLSAPRQPLGVSRECGSDINSSPSVTRNKFNSPT